MQWLKVIAQFNGGRQLSKHQAQAMTKLETKVMERKKKKRKTMHKNNKNSRKTNKKKESQSLCKTQESLSK